MTPSGPRGFPTWDELYRNDSVEHLPWYWPSLDPDLEVALVRHGVAGRRALDLGSGPGTQAIALAQRGFRVTASDVSPAAVAYAARHAKARGVDVSFVVDDVLDTHQTGPFDVIFDRGCFHVIAPDRRDRYAEIVRSLVAPGGWLFVKTFSNEQPGDQGPYRFTPDEIRLTFAATGRFEIVEVTPTVYQGQRDPWPKALFAAMRPR